MPKKKIYFMGLLANTDSSILKVKLNHGFKIKAMSDKEGADLISVLEVIVSGKALEMLFDFYCLNFSERRIYFINNCFESDIEIDESGLIINYPSKVSNFHYNFVQGYLKPVIRLMRLFKEGNICMPFTYYYFIDNDTPRPLGGVRTHRFILSEQKYTLKDSEILDLEKYIHRTILPFKKPFLQLAFENFELSYNTRNINLSFLSLIIALEALFNRSQPELAYTISRNTSVLLGKGVKESNNIFQEMKEFYKKRSAIVHSGKSNIINDDDLLTLRNYVRESIKEIFNMHKDKDEVLDLLNSLGFGDRPWRMRNDANKILVKGWHNGSQNNETGGGYGIKIADKKDRKRYFQKEWTSVTIELEGEGEIEVNLSNKFWNNCPELRKKEIGKWMLNNDFAPWKKYSPPKFELEPLGNNKFRLHIIKPSPID